MPQDTPVDIALLRMAGLLNNTKEIPVGVLQHNKVGIGRVTPRIAAGSKRQQAFDLRIPVLSIEVEVHPVSAPSPTVSCLER